MQLRGIVRRFARFSSFAGKELQYAEGLLSEWP